MPTSPKSIFLAAVTKTLPGPHSMSTAGTVSVPYAMAAIACAPPMPKTRSTPAMSAATSTDGSGEPLGPGGVTAITSETPAILAGTMVMMAVEGSGAEPAGTYAPARPTALKTSP